MTSGSYANYDYAWKQPGWSVQNPTIPAGGTDAYLDPGLPSDVSTVRVYGSFLELDSGRGLEGVLRLRVSSPLVYLPTGQQVLGGARPPIRFDHRGFSAYLAATDDPQLVAVNGKPWVYHGVLTVRGVKQEFDFALPSAPADANILDLMNVVDQPQDAVLTGSGIPTETVPVGVDYVDTDTGDLYTWEA